MAITSCRECAGKVSTEADACPHCGAPDPAAVPVAAVPEAAPPAPAPAPRETAAAPVPPAPAAKAADEGRGLRTLLSKLERPGRPDPEPGIRGALILLALLLGAGLCVLTMVGVGITGAVMGGLDWAPFLWVTGVPLVVFLVLAGGLAAWRRWALFLSVVPMAAIVAFAGMELREEPWTRGPMIWIGATLLAAQFLWSRRHDFRSGAADQFDRTFRVFGERPIPTAWGTRRLAPLVAVSNALARAGSLAAADEYDLGAAAGEHGGIGTWTLGAERQALYRHYLLHAVSGGVPDEESAAGLERLRRVLRIDGTRLRLARREAYVLAARRALADGDLRAEERERLAAVAAWLELPEGWAKGRLEEEKGALAKAAVKSVAEDQRLSAGEEDELKRLLSGLGVPEAQAASGQDRRKLERYRAYWALENEPLPILAPQGSRLEPGEVCHAVREGVVLAEETTRVTGVRRRASVRRSKGLFSTTYYVSDVRETPITDTRVREIDRGRLLVTGDRLLFEGKERTRSLPFSRLTEIAPGPAAVTVRLDDGAPMHFRFAQDVDFFAITLERAVRDALGAAPVGA